MPGRGFKHLKTRQRGAPATKPAAKPLPAPTQAAKSNAVPSHDGYGTKNTGGCLEVDYLGDNRSRVRRAGRLLIAGVGVLCLPDDGLRRRLRPPRLPSIGLNLIITTSCSASSALHDHAAVRGQLRLARPGRDQGGRVLVLPPAIAASVGEMVGSDSFFVSMMSAPCSVMPLTVRRLSTSCSTWISTSVIYLVVIIWLVNSGSSRSCSA